MKIAQQKFDVDWQCFNAVRGIKCVSINNVITVEIALVFHVTVMLQ